MKFSNGYKRTPNCECIICRKPLYRRPFEFKKIRYVACRLHRSQAQRMFPLTKKQKNALVLGREKGTNHLEGIPKSPESNRKRSIAHKKWCKENPEKLAARGEKTRRENHYNWKGGTSRISLSIRRMSEMRRWKNEIVWRDKICQKCFTDIDLEAHHKKTVIQLIDDNKITNRDEARNCKELWDLNNGKTFCIKCHCEEHGRKYISAGLGRKKQPRKIRRSFKGKNNPNYKKGLIKLKCQICKREFYVKNCLANKQKFCSKQCADISKRKSNSIRTLKGKYDNNK